MGLFSNITKSIGKIAPIAIPAMIGFGFGGFCGGHRQFFQQHVYCTEAGSWCRRIGFGRGLGQRQEHSFEERPEPVGKDFAITSRMRDGRIVQLNDAEDLADYRREIQGGIATMYHGGEVTDQGPAHLIPCLPACPTVSSMTAAAVRGAGGGDRDIGAARMYDMMAELEAQA